MYELSIVRSFLSRDCYNSYRNYISKSDFSKELGPVLDALDLWYQNNTVDCSVDDLANLVFANPVNKDYFREVFGVLGSKTPLESTKTLLEGFRRQRLLEDISSAAYEASTGRKSIDAVSTLVDKLGSVEISPELEFVTDDLQDIVDSVVATPGLRWRLRTLNEMLGSLRKGDFGFIFARPETGKTMFLASEITYMASQLKEEEGPILWFNLEEEGRKVKFRLFQAALGLNKEQILSDIPRAQALYLEHTHGKILLYDDATTTMKDIERACEKYQPSLVVIDQLDKVHGFQNDREDLRVGSIYLRARELAKRYCPFIGVCQASAEGEGREFLTMAEVSNSKTSKAAEADWILGIGRKHDAGVENIRGLSVLKNKLLGDSESNPEEAHGRRQVLVRPAIQRYIDIG